MDQVQLVCDFCPRLCRLEKDQVGFCGVRANFDGRNIDWIYANFDPEDPYVLTLETPPSLLWFMPNCNLKCPFCAAPQHSRPDKTEYQIDPEIVAATALTHGARIVSFTGGEPALHVEYVEKASSLCRRLRIETAIMTNGYVSESLAGKIACLVDRVAVGIKGCGSRKVYSKMNADPTVVLGAIKAFWKYNRNTAICCLVSPGFGDTSEDAEMLATFLETNTSREIMICIDPVVKPSIGDLVGGSLVAPREEVRSHILKIAEIFDRGGFENVYIRDLTQLLLEVDGASFYAVSKFR